MLLNYIFNEYYFRGQCYQFTYRNLDVFYRIVNKYNLMVLWIKYETIYYRSPKIARKFFLSRLIISAPDCNIEFYGAALNLLDLNEKVLFINHLCSSVPWPHFSGMKSNDPYAGSFSQYNFAPTSMIAPTSNHTPSVR